MPASLQSKYERFYHGVDPLHVYPVEFVVRAFLGNYPRLKTRNAKYLANRILDLGFGDGRNMPLLKNLGMHVFGIEISQEICDLTQKRMRRLGVDIETRVGRNNMIPYEDSFFDRILACHSCYYVDVDTKFGDNVREIARVLKPGGTFVFSAPIGTSYILQGAKELGDGHMVVSSDPYGVRNGCILKKFDSESDIETALSPHFDDFSIGSCRNDFWGIDEHVWIVVCRRAMI